jgi:hypothetical protein
MITAARAEGYVRVFAYRTGQETARGERLRATTFALCVQACEAARCSATYDAVTALTRIGDGLLDVDPYGQTA